MLCTKLRILEDHSANIMHAVLGLLLINEAFLVNEGDKRHPALCVLQIPREALSVGTAGSVRSEHTSRSLGL